MKLETYRPSVKVGRGMIVLLLISLAAIVPFSGGYGFLSAHNSRVGKTSLFLPLILGLAVGGWVYAAAYLARCPNMRLVRVASIISGLAALYASWAGFAWALCRHVQSPLGFVDFLMRPDLLWNLLLTLSQTQSIRIYQGPTGVMAWGLWTIDALLVCGCAALFAPYLLSGRVFCDSCGRWCKRTKNVARFKLPQAAQLLRAREGDLTVLAELEPIGAKMRPALRLDLQRCESGCAMATYQLIQVCSSEDVNFELSEPVLITGEALKALQAALTRKSAVTAALLPGTPEHSRP